MNNIITANFEEGKLSTIAGRLDNKPIYQWNYGQILKIYGLTLQKAIEIHFAHNSMGGTITRIGNTNDNVTTVAIPERFLEESGVITAYIYVSDSQSGQTEYKAMLDIQARPKPEAWDRPEDIEVWRETIDIVNDAMVRSEAAANKAEDKTAEVQASYEAIQGTIDVAGELKTDLDASSATALTNLNELRGENFNSKEILSGVADIRSFLGLQNAEVAGLTVDFENKTFTRIAGATGLTAGVDFDKWKMYGGRKRCNVLDDGTITAYYGDANYKEDGSNGQVMVYQPKFYYLMYPIKLEPITPGIGYHVRKANYYVSDIPLAGFKLHPAFYDVAGNEIDYIMMGAYEGSIFDVSESAYILDDAQVMDYGTDKFCSIAGAKPASGKTQNLTRPNINQMCMNRGAGWYSDNIKATSANQMLMIIEMGMMDMQTAIGQGVVSVADNPNTENNSIVTGGTSALGNGTGQATGTSGQVSVSYRGYENPWGNIWKFIYGVNIWGDGTLGGGVPYYATDFNFAESKRTDNYVSAGFSVANAYGYISAIGYASECDWMFIGSEVLGNGSVPVGDYQWTTVNLNGYTIAQLGGSWLYGSNAGAFFWHLANSVGHRGRSFGGRLVYVPTAS